MNTTDARTVVEQFAQKGRTACQARVAYCERAGLAIDDEAVAAIASWYWPLAEADVRRALWVRYLLDTRRLAAELSLGN